MTQEEIKRLINPRQFVTEVMAAIASDPGTEKKLMGFYLDDEEIQFVEARSEARVMSITFTRRKPEPPTITVEAEKINAARPPRALL